MGTVLAWCALVVLVAFEIACMVEIVRLDRKASREAKESEVQL